MSKRNWTSLCFVLYAVFELASSQRGYIYPPQYSDLPPGPYCEEKGCCLGRKDECSAPILGTLCYCDDFCNGTRVDDCCPDYWTHCKGYVISTTIRAPPEKKTCTLNGRNYGFGAVVKTNCNVCKCEVVNDDLGMSCERDECLIESSTIDSVNRDRNFGWTASNHTEFWGRKLSEGIQLRLGTLLPENFVMQMNPIITFYDPNSLPREFNAEKQWPNLISGVQEQGWCASSWAISTAAVASDRFGIVSGGTENVRLSAQHLLSCDPTGKQGCQGGQLDRAWATIRRYGLVDENCFPYVGYSVKCPFAQYTSDLSSSGCQLPPNGLRTSKYRVGAAYRLGNETDIMYEILNSGPVQATMLVHKDFFTYQSGIYKHTGLSQSSQTGYLSVRIVGWGEEYNYNGYQKYWKVANSWGQDWGENGYFKIARGTDESEIESFVIAAWPTVVKKIYNNNRFG